MDLGCNKMLICLYENKHMRREMRLKKGENHAILVLSIESLNCQLTKGKSYER